MQAWTLVTLSNSYINKLIITLKVNSLAYIANGWKENENLVTVRLNSSELQNMWIIVNINKEN